ncbi:hypothetical protein ACQKII_24120 [Lysinibacillus sp. NPDC048646]|uniref:hypothetical protein n=1 Tax=Lysinibacillus sp. NPDC048646 TaxID=3390574 RepID=UPI003D037C77
MKKYWKTILISLVIVTTIGSYYIQLAMASKNDVSFKIETTSGNKEEIENLILQADYQSGNTHRWLYISKDGSTDRFRRPFRSFIENLIAPDEPSMFQKYIQEHRNFMRGKDLYPSLYFEDEARLIYTDISDNYGKVIQGNLLTFNIDILDKNTNDSTSFEINTPVQASYNWMNVNDIYVEDGKIKILATGHLINGGVELHIYTLDESNKELQHDAMIAKVESEEGVMPRIRIFNDADNIQNENYYLYMVEKYKNQKEDAEPETIPSQIYLYNNLNNEVEEWTIPAELKPNVESMVLHGADIFIPVPSANGIEVNRYNIEKKQWEEPVNFNYPSTFNDKDVPFLQLTDGKLYLVNRIADGHLLFIGDLRTGESLYEGKIIVDNSENRDTDYSLNIQQLDIIN